MYWYDPTSYQFVTSQMPQEGDPEANSGLLLTSFDLNDMEHAPLKLLRKPGEGKSLSSLRIGRKACTVNMGLDKQIPRIPPPPGKGGGGFILHSSQQAAFASTMFVLGNA